MDEQVVRLFDTLNEELYNHPDDLTSDIIDTVQQILLKAKDSEPSVDIEEKFLSLAQAESTPVTAIFLFSAALSIQRSYTVFLLFLDYCYEIRKQLQPDTVYYLYGQLENYIFNNPHLSTVDAKIKVYRLFDYVVSYYEKELQDYLDPIGSEERDPQFVLVLTEQFLGFQHGPTKSAVDRCKILMQYLGKKVLLINTAELLSVVGKIPFINGSYANYQDMLISADSIEWKSCIIPYFQCNNDMPNPEEIKILLSMIRRTRPDYIISIGSGGIVVALASKLVPTLCVGMVPSDLAITKATFQTLSRPLDEDDRRLLQAMGKTDRSVIIGTFGSSILEQKHHLERSDIGLPAEKWLAAVVGARLDAELTSDFWNMAQTIVLQEEIDFVIIGRFSAEHLEKTLLLYPALQGRVHNLGFAEDVLGYLDLCDLYINPIRRGGGTSCVEAMSLGIPVITTSFGDVAVNAGEAFLTESYDTMVQLISDYIWTPAFYQKQSQKAKERSKVLLNAEKCFVDTVSEFLIRSKADPIIGKK